MTLDQVRINIDHVDRQMKELFQERMAMADQVAQVKAATGEAILKPDRESAMISRLTENVRPEIKREYRAFLKRMIEVSREYQYGRTLELRDCSGLSWKKDIENLTVLPEHNRIRLMFACADRSGSLAGLLTLIADYGINLTEIKTCPEWKQEGSSAFSVELDANLLNNEVQALMFQLSSETVYFRVLGSYNYITDTNRRTGGGEICV